MDQFVNRAVFTGYAHPRTKTPGSRSMMASASAMAALRSCRGTIAWHSTGTLRTGAGPPRHEALFLWT
jgi:hypothetical protein